MFAPVRTRSTSQRAPISISVRVFGAVLLLAGWQLATQLAAPKIGAASGLHSCWMWLVWIAKADSDLLEALLVPAAIGLTTTAIGLGLVLQGVRLDRNNVPTAAYGSARWSTTDELRSAGLGTEGVVLCQEASAALEVVPSAGERPRFRVLREAKLICARELHVLVEASTGSGKGENVVLPTALSDRGRSAVFLDPSGELWLQSAGWRSLHSCVLHVTPCSSVGSGFNPLMEVPRGIGELSEAERIAHVLVGSNERDRHEGLVYWQAAEKLLAGAFLYVLHYEDRKSLPGTQSFLANPARQSRQILADMASCRHPQIRDIGHELLRMTDNVVGGAFTTALNVLSFCTDPLVANTLDRSDFVAADLNQIETPLSVYISIPESQQTRLNGLARLLTNSLVSGIRRLERRHDVVFVLDEFCAPGPLPALADGVADLRKYGVQLVLLAQDRSQIYATYKDKARAIINNCGAQLAFGVNELTSAEVISKMLGISTVKDTRTAQSKTTRVGWFDGSRTASEGEFEHARELLTPDEVRALDPREVLLFLPGLRAYRGVKVVRYADRRFSARAKIAPPSSLALELPPRRARAWSVS